MSTRNPRISSPSARVPGGGSSLEALVAQLDLPALVVDGRDVAIHHNVHAQATLAATRDQLLARPVWDFLEACQALEAALREARRGGSPGAVVTVASRRRGRKLQATLIALREARETTLLLLHDPPPEDPARGEAPADESKLVALGTLVASVVHELRTPLTYARNNLEIVDRGLRGFAASGPEAEGRAGRIGAANAEALRGIDRACAILGELRPLSQNRRRRVEPVDLADLAVAAARQFRMTDPGGVRVALDLQATHEVQVDRDAVLAALLNLLRNAGQALGGQGVVTVETRNETRPPRIRVIDHGPGIAPESAAHLFEPFHTTKPEGTGLGLFIARQAILAQGGTLRHEDTPGGGATFVIEFPT